MFHRITICVLAPLLVSCALAIAACGGSGATTRTATQATSPLFRPTAAVSPAAPAKDSAARQVVARVGEEPITKATLEHWMGVGVTATEVPQPPMFTACVQRLKRGSSNSHGRPPLGVQTLKRSCERQYDALKASALDLLIYSDWLFGEASLLGLQVSDADVRHAYEKNVRSIFPTEAAFAESLVHTGRTASDVLYSTKISLTQTKIREWLKDRPGAVTVAQKQQVFEMFVNTWHARWIRRTRCAHGFIVADCSEYPGPRKPPRDPYLL